LGISLSYLCDKYFQKLKLITVLIFLTYILSNYFLFSVGYYKSKSANLNIENNRTLALAGFIKSHTPPDKPLVIYGYEWSSELGFYSERKSLSLPWSVWDVEAVEHPEHFLKDSTPSAYILCPTANIELIRNAIRKKFPNAYVRNVSGCDVYLLGKNIDGIWNDREINQYVNETPVDINNFNVQDIQLTPSKDGIKILVKGPYPVINFNKPIQCGKDQEIALQMVLNRDREGPLQIYYDSKGNYKEEQSVRENYPSGHIIVRLIFKGSENGTYIRFDPLRAMGDSAIGGVVEIYKISAYCLE
jgi:hypothetical protein